MSPRSDLGAEGWALIAPLLETASKYCRSSGAAVDVLTKLVNLLPPPASMN
jgi:hypothetical protein